MFRTHTNSIRSSLLALITLLTTTALLSGPLVPVLAGTFNYGFKSVFDSNADDYLVGQENVKKFPVSFYPPVDYWGPSLDGVEGILTYKFDFAEPSETIHLKAHMVCWDFVRYGAGYGGRGWGSVSLWGSLDGTNFELLADIPRPNALAESIDYNQDLPSSLLGGSSLWLQMKLFSVGSPISSYSVAQFSRNNVPNDGNNVFELNVVTAPISKFEKVVLLNFEQAIPGGIRDKNGLGTGFSDWLPGTGGSIPRHDPNLDLQAMPGYLSFTSQRADINQQNPLGQNLDTLDAPGILLTEMAGRDLRITARFDDVSVADSFDQLELYVGTDADNVLRGGMHQAAAPNDGQFVLAGNTGSGDFGFPLIGLPGSFTTGDDIVLALSRIDGRWIMEWDNLTNPAGSGKVEDVSVPWLDGEESLYVGLMHMDARNNTSQVAKVDYFCVEVGAIPDTVAVPEPLSLTLLALGMGAVLLRRR